MPDLGTVLFDVNPLPAWLLDAESLRFLAVNDAALSHYGYTRDEFLAMTARDLQPDDEREPSAQSLAALEEGDGDGSRVVTQRRRDGSLIEVEVLKAARVDYHGRAAVLVIAADFDERQRRLIATRTLDAVTQLGNFGTYMLDLRDGIYRLSGLAARVYGRSQIPRHEFLRIAPEMFHPDDASVWRSLMEAGERLVPWEGTFRVRLCDEIRWIHLIAVVVRAPDGTPTARIGVLSDVTEQVLERERLTALAYGDPETGLPNRRALLEQRDTPAGAALLLVRLASVAPASHLREETRTRHVQALAAALRGRIPSDALLVRYRDYGFAILVDGDACAPFALARRIMRTFERPVAVEDGEFLAVPTIGISTSATGDVSVAELARRAEAALGEAERGAKRLAIYSSDLEAGFDRHATIARNLRHAIADGRLTVAYQPTVSLQTGRIVGAEALMRWDCPGIGRVAPDEFIPIAEESAVILSLGSWMLREACAQNRRWQQEGLAPIRIAVNVPARQAQERDLVGEIRSVCESTRLSPSYLELELTERVMMHPDDLAVQNLEALRRLGVRIAVDDFGTGYSALSYLANLPLDTLKLDRTLVDPIAGDPFQAEIAESVIRLAHRRGLSVVGEGVETDAQLECLRAMGCDDAQGFYLAHPMSADAFAELLRRQEREPGAIRRAIASVSRAY